jgi:hypothetical protein
MRTAMFIALLATTAGNAAAQATWRAIAETQASESLQGAVSSGSLIRTESEGSFRVVSGEARVRTSALVPITILHRDGSYLLIIRGTGSALVCVLEKERNSALGQLMRELTLYDRADSTRRRKIDEHVERTASALDSMERAKHARRLQGYAPEGSVITSQLDGLFLGFSLGRRYSLENGTEWEQVSTELTGHSRDRPRVVIYPSAEGLRLDVEEESEAAVVRRVR